MRIYTLLTREQRYQLSTLLKMGHSQIEIAEVTGMNNMKYLSKKILSAMHIVFWGYCAKNHPVPAGEPEIVS